MHRRLELGTLEVGYSQVKFEAKHNVKIWNYVHAMLKGGHIQRLYRHPTLMLYHSYFQKNTNISLDFLL